MTIFSKSHETYQAAEGFIQGSRLLEAEKISALAL